MKRSWVAIIFIVPVLCGCSENSAPSRAMEEFNVVVEDEMDISCRLPMIRFTNKLDKVKKITQHDGATFTAHALGGEFHVEGLELVVRIRKTKDTELSPCLMIGIPHPWVTIVDARLKN